MVAIRLSEAKQLLEGFPSACDDPRPEDSRRIGNLCVMGAIVDLTTLPAEACELEDSVALLCWIASAAHACGDYSRRDDAVDLAAELARGLSEQAT